MKNDDVLTVRIGKYREQDGKCGVCGDSLSLNGAQLAHKIPQRKWCIKRFSAQVIHHPMNMVLVCGLECNARAQINPDSLQAERLAAKIRKDGGAK